MRLINVLCHLEHRLNLANVFFTDWLAEMEVFPQHWGNR